MASQVGWGYRTTGLEGSPEGSRDGLGVANSARPRPGPEPGLRQNPEEGKNRSEQKPGVEPALVPEPELAWARTTDQSQLLVSRRIWKKFLFRSRCGKPSPDGSGKDGIGFGYAPPQLVLGIVFLGGPKLQMFWVWESHISIFPLPTREHDPVLIFPRSAPRRY